MAAKRSVGFIGLGNIGKPMAKHLVSDGFDAYVYDVVPAAMTELVAMGAKGVDRPTEMFSACNHIGLC
ncbi:MAG: hypothetical protein KDI30_01295, partial [Pseudomonadales bacterium]|nr:hypothetical protein [Pseudomonadales bacterium]